LKLTDSEGIKNNIEELAEAAKEQVTHDSEREKWLRLPLSLSWKPN